MPAESVPCYQENNSFPGSPTLFAWVDTSLARIGRLQQLGNLGREHSNTAAQTRVLLVRWRGGGYWVEQPMLAMTDVWLNKFSSHSFSFPQFPFGLVIEEFKVGLIHLVIHTYVHSLLNWRPILCLVLLGTASTVLNKTAKAWGPLDPTV